MDLLGQDLYIVTQEKNLNAEQMASLTNMYMPLVSPLSICLYLVLLKRPLASQNFGTHLQLCETLQCRIDELQRARIELEHFLLLKTYLQNEQGQKLYLYETQYPLNIHSFLLHATFARLLVNKVGTQYVERYSQEVMRLHHVSEAEEITQRMQLNIEDWNMDKEEFIRENMDILPSVKKEDPYSEYDIISYLRTNDPDEFMIPRSKISVSDIELINYYGLRYQIRKEEMVKILHKNVNRSTGKLNKDNFVIACASKSEVKEKKKADYTMQPLEFAACLVNSPLKSDEVKAIRDIQTEYLLDNETMNYIIEKSVLNTDLHRVVPNYIAVVAKDLTSKKNKPKEENKKSEPKSEEPKKKTSTRGYRRIGVVPEYAKMSEVPSVDPDKLREKLDAIKKKRVM